MRPGPIDIAKLRRCMHSKEDQDLEFKYRLPGDEQRERERVLRGVAALANINGGYIVFGVGEENDGYGNRKLQSITSRHLADHPVIQAVRDTVQPTVSLLSEEVVIGEHTLLVLTVEAPFDQLLRTCRGVAYTRDNQPATLQMTSQEIWNFHRSRLRSVIQEELLRLSSGVAACLAQLAFESYNLRGRTVSWNAVKAMIQAHAEGQEDDICRAVLNHDTIRFDGSIERPTGVGFRYRGAMLLYTALHLNRLQPEDARKYLLDPGWEDAVLILASIVESERLNNLIQLLINNEQPIVAMRCLIERDQRMPLDATLRATSFRLIQGLLQSNIADVFHQGRVLTLLERYLRRETDDRLRVQILGMLQTRRLPELFVNSLTRHLDPEIEHDPTFQNDVARTIARVLPSPQWQQNLMGPLLKALAAEDREPEVVETLLIALANHSSHRPDTLTFEQAFIVERAIDRVQDWYEGQKLPRPFKNAVRRIHTLIEMAQQAENSHVS
jgi:hypothetical protein